MPSATYTFGDLLGFVESSSGYNHTPSSKHLFDCLVVLTPLRELPDKEIQDEAVVDEESSRRKISDDGQALDK